MFQSTNNELSIHCNTSFYLPYLSIREGLHTDQAYLIRMQAVLLSMIQID